MYEIISKSDFKTGATLVVNIPETQVDKTALLTIVNDTPDFILPFHYRSIDGQIELTYRVENRSKLAYLSASRSSVEYVDLWYAIIGPLMECTDWFMEPFSFVLLPECIYCDKSGKQISYIYIPSVTPYSNIGMLKSMVTEIAKQNHSTDINLENKVVWALQDFNPAEFLEMLKPYKAAMTQVPVQQSNNAASAVAPVQAPAGNAGIRQTPAAAPVSPPVATAAVAPAPAVPATPGKPVMPGDIVINFPPDGKPAKQEKSKQKKADTKDNIKSDKKSSFFGKKKQQEPVIQGGAAAQHIQPGTAGAPAHVQAAPFIPTVNDIVDEETQILSTNPGVPKFRYIGNSGHPPVIEVKMAIGEVFSIGRFDVSAGKKQNAFEFNQKTKAVSRRHAVIVRKQDSYCIVDIGSSAGTFYNGHKLPQNAEFKLEPNSRISFGNLGADYVWEEQ